MDELLGSGFLIIVGERKFLKMTLSLSDLLLTNKSILKDTYTKRKGSLKRRQVSLNSEPENIF